MWLPLFVVAFLGLVDILPHGLAWLVVLNCYNLSRMVLKYNTQAVLKCLCSVFDFWLPFATGTAACIVCCAEFGATGDFAGVVYVIVWYLALIGMWWVLFTHRIGLSPPNFTLNLRLLTPAPSDYFASRR